MDVEQWKSLILGKFAAGEGSQEFRTWVMDCVLLAHETGDVSDAVDEEIQQWEADAGFPRNVAGQG